MLKIIFYFLILQKDENMRMKMTKLALTQFLIVAILLNASYSGSDDLVKGKSHTIYASWLYSSVYISRYQLISKYYFLNFSDVESICSNQEGCDEPSSVNKDESKGSECGCNESRKDKNEQKRETDPDKVFNVIVFIRTNL